jgi:hypothetical protein
MTRRTNARIAGYTFLLYIAAGITSMVVFGRAAAGVEIAAKLASIAQHETQIGVVYLLALVQSFCAIVLGVTLYAITRDEDPDLAMLGLTFRVGEGLIGISFPTSMVLLWLATATGANAPDARAAQALGSLLRQVESSTFPITATFFAVGSTFFAWLLLRGRMIPVTLAWLGVAASVLLVIVLPLQGAGFVHGKLTSLMWIPMALFEVVLALLLIVKGVRPAASKLDHNQPHT